MINAWNSQHLCMPGTSYISDFELHLIQYHDPARKEEVEGGGRGETTWGSYNDRTFVLPGRLTPQDINVVIRSRTAGSGLYGWQREGCVSTWRKELCC